MTTRNVEDPIGNAGRWASVSLGLPVPLLFAVYSVYFSAVKPNDSHLATLAAVQVGCIATAATALFGLRTTIANWNSLRHINHSVLKYLVLLNLFSLLGPPLWFVAIVLLGASPANWIDLGLLPALTIAAAIVLRKDDRPRGPFASASVTIASVGIAILLWDVYERSSSGPTNVVGALVALVSAVGTTGAGVCLSHLQRDLEESFPPSSYLFLRYAFPSVVLLAIWIFEAARLERYGLIVGQSTPTFIVALSFFYILPNYVYVVVLKKKKLLYAGYMWAFLPVFSSAAEIIWFGPNPTFPTRRKKLVISTGA